MSIITNTPVKRGDKLSSSDLNQQFSDVNAAFPLGAENVSPEAVDLAAMIKDASSGESGIVLKHMQQWVASPAVIVPANTAATPPFDPWTVIHTEVVGLSLKANDIFRAYWNLEHTITGNSQNMSTTTGGFCWAVWLEWQVGGVWVPVPNQDSNRMESLLSLNNYGAFVEDSLGTSLQQHVTIYDTNTRKYGPIGSTFGQWYYKIPSDMTITGVRLVGRGMFLPYYTSNKNCLRLQAVAAGNHQISIDGSQLGIIQMRDR